MVIASEKPDCRTLSKITGIFALILVLTLVGCTTKENINKDIVEGTASDIFDNKYSALSISSDVEKIEVYHFHGANQCFSCRTIKEFAEKTVYAYYQDLVDSGKMEFRSIDGELLENREVTLKYGATGSSLWIGTYINGEFHKEQNTNVWYKVNDEADFTSYLKGVLDKRLSGDLS